MERLYKEGDKVRVILTRPLGDNSCAPPLVMYQEHKVNKVIEDTKGNQHLDIGLVSKINYVTSFETKEELPDGDKIHWCHPSRFELI
jgi:hypothetical protein